ncbi:galactose oxidase [Tricholoma matsutake]|nr:galactose oxidase [Tricholoma matsutake 945]
MNRLLYTLCFAYLLSDPVAAYNPLPRWGQATVMINDTLFVHGGKTDQYNSYSYSSAPTNTDLLCLSLSSSFDVSSPSWQLLNSSSSNGPAVAWHTLSAFSSSGVLLFGGQPGPNSPTVLVDRSDSASLLNINNLPDPEWVPEAASWAGQPLRRMHHSAVTAPSGLVYIIGGEKADGSNNVYSDNYIFDSVGPSFTLLPADNGPPGVYGHASIILPDGRLLVFGGYSQSRGTLLPFSTIFIMDTSRSNLSWSTLSTLNSSLPAPRRAFAAALLSDGKILIHGGSDAVLQNNFADGWILDTSQNPMVWTHVEALSQLGARREHFAVSSGSQVIFGFGYGANTAAPTALQIFDVAKRSFTSTFSPPSPSFTQSQTLPSPSPTSDHVASTQGGHPTTTTDPAPGRGTNTSNHSTKTIAIAVGAVFGFIGVAALVLVYYVRRRQRRTRSERRFVALNDSDDSADSAEGIPAVRFSNDPISYNNQHGWGFRVFDTIGLASILSAATGGRTVRHIPERRDMLADEDTREFGEWYDARRRDGSDGSAWSLRNILGARIRSREPSATSTLGEGTVFREKSDPFSDELALVRAKESGQVALAVAADEKSQGLRQTSSSSSRDYVQVHEHVQDEGVPSRSASSKHPSQNTLLLTQDPPTNSASSLSPSVSPNSSLQSSSSNQTSSASVGYSRFPGQPPSSIIGSSPTTTSQAMRRSDSWWARFSRTSFLDRRVSDASKRSSGMLDIRDPNPRPQLNAIEESTHLISPDYEEQHSRLPSESANRGHSSSTKPSGEYGAHNKSSTSLGTADTEMIEKMAGAVDVVQRFRTASTNGRTHSTTSSAYSLTVDVRFNLLGEVKGIATAEHEDVVPSPVDMSYTESVGPSSQHSQPQSFIRSKIPPSFSSSSPESSATSLESNHSPRVGTGAVASRIREYERKMSLDQEVPSPTNTRQHEERLGKKGASVAVHYGLVQRPSLFIANPDGRATPSGD